MSNDSSVDPDWAALLDLSAEERDSRMVEAYTGIAALSEEDRQQRLEQLIRTVYAMPDAALRTMTESRLRAWLRMDPGQAATVGRQFETALNGMPANIAMRRVTIVQSVSGNLALEDREKLRHIVPGVLGDEPLTFSGNRVDGTPGAAPAPVAAKPRPWWQFWRR
ncbi:MAG: hypothetical protein KC482_16335 [Dehalococcoidia bacterium]|nr:hypothetical protein [Dehalococcoidia bacterium]MCA9843787.1 hypothetical protein [Dehalococcoidia bacterium]MCA9855124.1 hypothetical protein [Dehalococcoidia bacterium]